MLQYSLDSAEVQGGIESFFLIQCPRSGVAPASLRQQVPPGGDVLVGSAAINVIRFLIPSVAGRR